MAPGHRYKLFTQPMLLLAWKCIYFILCNFLLVVSFGHLTPSEPQDALQIFIQPVTFGIKMDVFYSVQFFDYLFIFAY